MGTLVVDGRRFLRDGVEHRILSGALHYFRVHPGQWQRQLRMLRAMGLNTVETYVPWNLHERAEGVVERLDELAEFLDLAAGEDLDAIVRPGPYICAEWDNGGLPAWVTHRQGARIRCADPQWLACVDAWFDRLIPVIAERQSTRGGNVVMVQVENEYGSFGSDKDYLAHLRDGLLARGIDVPLFTSDGSEQWMLEGGTLPDVLATVNFGSGGRAAFEALEAFRPGQPWMCMEFWDGWFDHWGGAHAGRSVDDAARELAEVLDCGASVNLYMAQGGTNFGTWSGANRRGPWHEGAFVATTTSYDYDAPIDEQGRPTAKFDAFRDLLRRHATTPSVDVPPPAPVLPAATIALRPGPAMRRTDAVSVRDVRTPLAPSLDDLGIDQGVAWHEAVIGGPRPALPLICTGVGDFLSVFADGRLVGRGSGPEVVAELPEVGPDGLRLELVVESLGRVNYGPRLGEGKGITGHVRHGQQLVHTFVSHAGRVDALPTPGATSSSAAPGPRFHTGSFDAPYPGDAWMAVDGVERAVVWVNGWCLGRLLAVGPQRTLYVPGPCVVAGDNTVDLLDLAPEEGREITLRVVERPSFEASDDEETHV